MLPASRVGDPKVLIVAPMSGHYATLLRGTVEAMLPEHDVFITDWTDARDVPLSAGRFDLDDYTDYLIEMLEFMATDSPRVGVLRRRVLRKRIPGRPGLRHRGSCPNGIAVLAVCQPGIPVMAAASLMAEDGNPARPSALVLMGSPIDTACNPKQPNEFAQKTPLASFERNAIMRVPWPHPGFGRRVYPGFLQLSSFLAMNLDRHLSSHLAHFRNLVRGDGDSADAHRRFYDEYLAVMDLPGEFYLQTIERVFQQRLMARGALSLPRPAGPSRGDAGHRPDDRRGREGRHHRRRTDRGRAPPRRRTAVGAAPASPGRGGRALRDLQRVALAQPDPAAGPRLHSRQLQTKARLDASTWLERSSGVQFNAKSRRCGSTVKGAPCRSRLVRVARKRSLHRVRADLHEPAHLRSVLVHGSLEEAGLQVAHVI